MVLVKLEVVGEGRDSPERSEDANEMCESPVSRNIAGSKDYWVLKNSQ